MKKLLTAITFLGLTACGTYSAPSQYYRAAGEVEQISISGTLDYKGIKTNISITVDGTTVIEEELPSADTFELSGGLYNEKSITASCSQHFNSQTFQHSVNCLVFVDNERAATLTF